MLRSGGVLEGLWEPLGELFGRVFGTCCTLPSFSGAFLGSLGADLASTWQQHVAKFGHLGTFLGHLGGKWKRLGA
eukprot:10748046-Karenia_brevis.AAC.1